MGRFRTGLLLHIILPPLVYHTHTYAMLDTEVRKLLQQTDWFLASCKAIKRKEITFPTGNNGSANHFPLTETFPLAGLHKQVHRCCVILLNESIVEALFLRVKVLTVLQSSLWSALWTWRIATYLLFNCTSLLKITTVYPKSIHSRLNEESENGQTNSNDSFFLGYKLG